MKAIICIAGLICLTIKLPAVPVFIGTSTGNNTASKGIYLADFDLDAGTLTKPELAAEYQNPGFLVMHPTKPVLLAVGFPNKPFADGSSSVAAFSIGANQELKFLGEASTGGKGACHLAIDATGDTVAVANYGDGKFATIRLDENGIPGKLVSVISNQGSGPNKARQEGPHAHGVYFGNGNDCLFVPDLGLDRVWAYPFDAATSVLGTPFSPLHTAPGAGPRHLALTKRELYVINELDSTVLTHRFAPDAKEISAVSTLPKGYTGSNTTAEIEVSADGRFVYASNRGHDSIAVFSRDKNTGALSLIQHAPCGGKTPRHFKIAPGGKWLLCAHMGSHTISVLPIEPVTGELGMPANTVASPSPICLVFRFSLKGTP